MPQLEDIGKWLVIGGVALVLVGGLVWLAGRLLGNQDLPGTIRIQGAGLTCIIPLLASIVISIVLTLVLNLAGRFLNR
jgi:uncharacterized membrane protein